MKLQNQKRNDLLKREEVIFSLEAEKNPSFSECKKMISEKFKKAEDQVDVYCVKGSFGKNSFIIKAYVYDSKDAFDRAVQKTQKQRVAEKKALEEAKKAEEEAKKAAATA